ncbi:hypothetical protein J6Q66_09560 [bacterium]|nr:hypothetical protein [bacterium]
MGLDGFSMRNLGAYQGNVPSSHLSFEAKQLAKVGREKQIQDVDELEKWEKINSEDNEEYSGTGGYSEGQDDDENEESSEKKFNVRLNPTTNLVELYDIQTNTLIETMTPQELMILIKNLNSASGIFVNKKI